ncbi:hypothetical protein [Streptomyces sp. NPDC054784]
MSDGEFEADAGALDVLFVRQESWAPAGETTAVRLLGLLPMDWICVPDDVGTDQVRLRIEYAMKPGTDHGCGGTGAARDAVAELLADGALRGWSAEEV